MTFSQSYFKHLRENECLKLCYSNIIAVLVFQMKCSTLFCRILQFDSEIYQCSIVSTYKNKVAKRLASLTQDVSTSLVSIL
jgi:hypothetical protein